ncbi:MAG TPA: hypothetical protein VMV21_18000 [Vicinamibacteria bacterium]|nr:hypothetical protein [Vicinamibacteria bacterium]
MEPLSPPAARARSAWPLVVSVLGLAAIVAGGVAFVAQRAVSLPGEMAREGRQALSDLRSVAAAFRSGTITTTFARESTALAGTTRLQFATLKQQEVFSRRDRRSLFWGQLPLPDVVVEARAPVDYTYYLDFEKPWTFRLEGEVLRVEAPAIEWNAPAIDASALRYEVREGSVLRDEVAVLEALRASLTEASQIRARDNVSLVRETGRLNAAAFVTTWLKGRFDDAKAVRVEVAFADEPRRLVEPAPR